MVHASSVKKQEVANKAPIRLQDQPLMVTLALIVLTLCLLGTIVALRQYIGGH